MRQFAVFLMVLVVLVLALPVLAQGGYVQTDTPPEAGMLPIGTAFTVPILNAQNGQFEHHPARIDHYIQWVSRQADYYVSLTDWPGAFFFFNRASLEQWVTLQQMVAGLLGRSNG